MKTEIFTPQIEREINIFGWKGKDNIKIGQTNNGFTIYEHRKTKETGEIITQKHFVPLENYNFILNLINKLDLQYQIGYRHIVKKIIGGRNLNVSIDAFNGGRNRAKIYFPYYYWPIKILEAQGKIAYFGKGGLMRLK